MVKSGGAPFSLGLQQGRTTVTFVAQQRIQQESSMVKILTGHFGMAKYGIVRFKNTFEEHKYRPKKTLENTP